MIGTRLADRYELTEELGRGTTGVVYRATDPLLGRQVAVKMIPVAAAGEAVRERFRRAAQGVARLDHPAIAPVFDFGRHQDSFFLVMPVVRGTTLKTLVADGLLTQGEILDVVAQAADGLDHAHGQGLLHGALSAANVLVSRQGGGGVRVWVVDFGLFPEGRTSPGGGEIAHLSPEAVLTGEIDSRSDLYSLGAVLYECLTGEPPFAGGGRAVARAILDRSPEPLEQVGVAPELAEIVGCCLAKEPAQRPARGRDLARRLRGVAGSLSESDQRRTPRSFRAAAVPSEQSLGLPFVGREEELAELERRIDRALAGELQLVALGGEPGSGKSRLLQKAEQLARGRGMRVLRGRFAGLESHFPYQGFCDLIQDSFRARGSSGAAAAVDLSDLAADLLKLFPALSEVAEIRAAAGGEGGILSGEEGDRTEIFELLARTLGRLPAGRPLTILLENLHAADVSIEALRYLFYRLAPTPMLIVGTYRQTEIDRQHRLHRLLDGLGEEPRVAVLGLGPLSRREHARLVASLVGLSRLPEPLAESLYQATDGNPFFTWELVRALIDSGDLSPTDPQLWARSELPRDRLPETIQQAVETRLERLPERVLEVLSVASVLGRGFEADDLLALLDDRQAAGRVVEELLRDGLLEQERPGHLHFASAMVRDVLYTALPRRRRRTLHRRHARDLENKHAGRLEHLYPRLVHHFSEGDEPDETVAYALMLARRSARTLSPADTARAARTALEFLEESAEDAGEVEGELRMLLAASLRFEGTVDGVLREASRAVHAFERAGAPAAAAGAARYAAQHAWQGRQVSEARRWIDKGIELARAAGAHSTLRELLTLGATVANLRADYEAARSLSEEAGRLPPAASPRRSGAAAAATAAAATAAAATEIRVPLAITFSSLDPARLYAVEQGEVIPNVFETLTRVGEGAHVVPHLARQLASEDGGRRFRCRLRRGVRFHDGRPLAAADVRHSFERLLRSPNPTAHRLLLGIRGARELRDGRAGSLAGLEVVADDELTIELERPLAFFPALLASPASAVVPRDVGEVGGDWRSGCAGTGPFRVRRFEPGARVELEANPGYWRPGLPRCARLVFELAMSAERTAAGFRAGELEVASGLSAGDVETLHRDPEMAAGYIEAPGFSTYFLAMNARRGPFAERQSRQALAAAINVGDLLLPTLGRRGIPAHGLVPPGLPGHEAEQQAEVGSAASLAGVHLSAAVHPSYLDPYALIWDGVPAACRELGAEIEVAAGSLAETLGDIAHGRHDLAAVRWIAPYPDSDSMTGLLHSRDGLLGRYFGRPEIDRFLERGRRETDPELRHAIYRELEQQLLEEALVIPLFHEQAYRFSRPGLRGLRLCFGWPVVAYEELEIADGV